ncbi:MAG TPA: amino acid adenylation domain-containing protein, partial [Herpetosiphonaceae bacterium]
QCGDATLTYAELNARANQLAHQLQALGVGPDVRVGLCLERSLDLVIGLLGILKAGGAYVPIDPSYPQERITFLLADAQLGALVTQAALSETLPPFAGVTVRLDQDTATIAEQPTTSPHTAVTPQDLAYVIYTSGSTGRPKGVLVEHRQVVNTLWGSRQQFGFAAGDVLPWLASAAFDIAVFELFSPLLVGGTTLIVRREEILDLPRLSVLLRRCTLLHAVPALLRQIVQQAEAPYPHMRRVFVGGEAVPPDLLAALPAVFRQAQVEVLYGPTETAILCTHYAVPSNTAVTGHPIGRPLPNHQIQLYDRHGQLVPIGVAGEIYVGGAGVTRGYLNRPELTAEKFVIIDGQRWYRTGDLARWRHDGTLEFLGRIDHQVKIRGFRIELGEIEAMLGQHPGVSECVVVVREDRPGDKQLVAYITEEQGNKGTREQNEDQNPEPRTQNLEDSSDPGSRFLDAQRAPGSTLRQYLKERLPEYMIPAAFVTLPELPKTLTGKLDRAALPAPELHPTTDDTFEAPTSPVEELLVSIWAEVLGVQRLSTRANFFALGGHSLLATQLVSRIRSALSVDLPLRQVFAAPTVAELAQHIATLRADDQSQPDAPPIRPIDRSRPLPLSFSQERLWFLDQLEPNSSLYSIPFVLRVTGRLALHAFEASLSTMISRHEILRTTFKLADGRPTQVIAPPAPPEVPIVDLRHLPADERETAAHELVSVEAHTPFDLDRGPLLRVTLIQLADSESLVLFTMHHIIADGWSTGVIVREFGPLYSAFARDEQPALPELAIQYADFAVWQRRWLQGDVLQQQLSYWRQQLGDESSRGAVPLLDLPTDRPRPSTPSYAGETIKFTLPQPLTDAVVALSQHEQVTPFMTLLAAFQVLLFRHSGQDDIAVGTPIANRNRREIEPLIGCFINTLVIRADLSGVPSFHELLGRVRQSTLGAYDHQDLPFEVLVDALQPTRQLSHNPLFQVMFTLQNTPRVAIETPDLQLAPVEIEYQRAKFDLTLTMSETPAGLVGALEYRTDLFDATTIERMAGHFQTLLEAIVVDPQRRIDRLPLLPDQEQRILQSWNARRVTPAPERWTHELFEAQAARTPEAVALIFDAEQMTYAELNRRANQLAHHLRHIGVRQESLVAVCLHRSMDLVVALLATLKAGGCYVPLDPAYPADRLRWMLEDTQTAVIVTSSRQQALLPAHSAHVLCLDTDSALIDQEPTTSPESLSSGASLAYVIYTSGSTGKPKGVGVGHAALVEHTVGIAELYELDPQDHVLEFASPSFDVSIEQILPTLISGACLVLRSAELWSPDEFTHVITQKRLTVLNLPPVYYRAWMLALTEANTPFPQQPRLIIVGGEAFPPDTARLWRRLEHGATRLLNAYGPTETIITATLYDMSVAPEAHALLSSVPIGRPIVERTAYVLDRAGAQVPIGVPGELYLGGSLLARGYLNRPDLTATQFVPDPFSQIPGARLYKTGDLVRYLADGTIEFLGRVDQQVKMRGFRIELGEIEAVLATHPAVQTALVVLRDERLVAYVVGEEPRTQNLEPRSTEQGNKQTKEQTETEIPPRLPQWERGLGGEGLASTLRAFLAEHLPEYMVPSTFVMLDALPLTPNGKIDRKALPALQSTQIGDGETFAAPRTPNEELIAGVWASVLGVERVSIHDNFFEIGGHSLLATQVVSRLRQVLSVELP